MQLLNGLGLRIHGVHKGSCLALQHADLVTDGLQPFLAIRHPENLLSREEGHNTGFLDDAVALNFAAGAADSGNLWLRQRLAELLVKLAVFAHNQHQLVQSIFSLLLVFFHGHASGVKITCNA